MTIAEAINYKEEAVALLSSEKLPTNDLPSTLKNFFVMIENKKLIGIIGLEIYGSYGLLRSLAVRADSRNQNIAGKLVEQIERLALAEGLKAVLLLTETATDYFSRKGYKVITRAEMPAEVRQSSEFSHVCPDSAKAMQKDLQ